MPTILSVLALPIVAGGIIARYLFLKIAHPIIWSPISLLPGPITATFWGSNLPALFDSKRSWKVHEIFLEKYGRTLRVFGLAKFDQRILTMDPMAIGYILQRSQTYQKPWQSRAFISSIIGESLFSAEGTKHRCQRRIADQAFGERNLQSFLPIMFTKSSQLTEKWIASTQGAEEGETTIETAMWVQRLSLDIIAEVGLGVNLDCVKDDSNKIHKTYMEMFGVLLKKQNPLLTFLGICIPKLQPYIPTDMFMTLRRCKATVYDFGMKLIDEKRRLLAQREKCKHRDFLTLFLKANCHPDVPQDQRMSDEELLDIVNTLLSGGSETTALAITWTLHYLSLHPEVQERLREELCTVQTYSPSQVCGDDEILALFESIDSLPYLDAVIKESLRLSPSIHSTIRVAMVDDEIPLSESMVMRDGKVENVLRVKQGQWIHLPLEAVNIDKTIWGDDAWEFKPERWEALPKEVSRLPGAYSHMLSFSAGPRVCIGMRFAHMEMKIVLHQLISCLKFKPKARIIKGTLTFSKPYVEEDWKNGRPSSLPLDVSRYLPDEAACI
ncbi:hypothetical protein FRC15_009878 [Serendipita sp. 397]|nr:hypothetical protein FRC15_009878 [Serendipita sp. 397]